MGCDCVASNKYQPREGQNRVQTDFYTPTEENSAEDFNPWEIQDKIDKHVQWEIQYYDWHSYRGKEADRPLKPGPHPDPKHQWNTDPQGFLQKMEEEETDDDSDYWAAGIDSKRTSGILDVTLRSEGKKSKVLFDF